MNNLWNIYNVSNIRSDTISTPIVVAFLASGTGYTVLTNLYNSSLTKGIGEGLTKQVTIPSSPTASAAGNITMTSLTWNW